MPASTATRGSSSAYTATSNATADAFGINSDAARSGDMAEREAFRRHARYWLTGDDLRAGRSKRFGNVVDSQGAGEGHRVFVRECRLARRR